MKLVLARQRIGARFGGAEGYVATLASALRRLGADVTLMAQKIDEDTQRAGFPVKSVPAWPTNVGGMMSFAAAVRREIAAVPDAKILSFDRIPGAPFIRAGDGVHRAYLACMRQIFSSRLSIKHGVMLFMERRAFTNPNLRIVIANSKMVAGEIHAYYGVPKENIQVVYTGLADTPGVVDSKSAARDRLGIAGDGKVALFAGHNFERKGLESLIHAFALSKTGTPDAAKHRLLVAGRGNISKHQSMAARMGLDGQVKFLGPCDLSKIFPAADLFVLPTRYDPLARVCLEAARFGIPVVTTRANGFSELMAGLDNFLMPTAEDIPGLTRILRMAYTSDLAAAGKRIREQTKHLTIDQNAKDILACLAR